MNQMIQAVILGIVEGLTEFLPVSSTGHMLLTMPLLGVDESEPTWKAFKYFVQIGAVLAVVIYFRERILTAVRRTGDVPLKANLAAKLLVAFIPAAVIGLLFNKIVDAYLETPFSIAVALIIGGAAMEWIERGRRDNATRDVDAVTMSQAFAIGVAQCVSIIPGTSRSMATILGGLLVGLSPAAAAEFSFLLAIPTLTAAGGYSLLKQWDVLRWQDAEVLAIGFVVSFVVALLVVDRFMSFVRTHRLRAFAIYRVLLGAVIIVALYQGYITAEAASQPSNSSRPVANLESR